MAKMTTWLTVQTITPTFQHTITPDFLPVSCFCRTRSPAV